MTLSGEKMNNQDKITANLLKLAKLKYNPNRSEYQLGVANMAELMLNLTTCHGNSYEYKSAMVDLCEMGRNAEKLIK